MKSYSKEIIYARMLEYLAENLGNYHRITVRDVHTALKISRVYLHMICKSNKGVSARRVINAAIIQKAIEFYYLDSIELKLIADKLGFSDVVSFYHFFKRIAGCNLMNYMDQHENIINAK
ncbi:MAG: helix-turn-helix domain-containing protein [Saprospiraceae bacterium]|nr:AraC family transcriptional regulator [Saprospiraceae bacterium]MBK8451046.1 AraC family transcriptional regulator [Saprospiraceae bacterium]MBK9222391.1 AraC family transcriptional regulator [Saprospiraceae bacterium]